MSDAHLTMGAHTAPPMEDRPFAISSNKLAIWLFIMADVMTFAACVVAYGFVRNATPDWPRPFHSVTNVAVMTVIMLASSLTMLMAQNAAETEDRAGAFRWLMITALGGALFTVLHIRDWMSMIQQGAGLAQNPWGPPAFGAAFYSITGFSLAHISVITIALVVVAFRYKKGTCDADDVQSANVLWQFVGLVWLCIVPLVYLMNTAN